MREITQIVIHCSDTPAGMDIGAKEIREWHTAPKPKGNGWRDIGYHYVIRRDGVLETGRDLDGDGDIDEEVGAHAAGHNANSIGICMVGGGKGICNFTRQQWSQLDNVVKALTLQYPQAAVCGHRDLNPGKQCPSFDARAWWNFQS